METPGLNYNVFTVFPQVVRGQAPGGGYNWA